MRALCLATITFHFLDLPSEIRIQIYEMLLVDSSIVLQYLFVRNHFRSMFRNETALAISAQIYCTALPQFDCSNCILGIEKLHANFNLIKRLTPDTEDLHIVVDAFRNEPSSGM
jgi:hypothetical protein